MVDDYLAILDACITDSKSEDEFNGPALIQQAKMILYNYFVQQGESEPDYHKKETLFLKAAKYVTGMPILYNSVWLYFTLKLLNKQNQTEV